MQWQEVPDRTKVRERQKSVSFIIIIITYIYNASNDALIAYRIHNKLKTILSKYTYKINSLRVFTYPTYI